VDEVILAVASLDRVPEELARFRATFSSHEQARAERFAAGRLREHWVAGRGLLRALLARATGSDPAGLRFTYAEHGKPALDPVSAPWIQGPSLTFNVSHSNGMALYALARGREVGVDLELVQQRRTDQLARRYFCPEETGWIEGHPEDLRREAFYAIWCAKEAYQKACGLGLALGLSAFCFTLDDQGPTALLRQDGVPDAPARWTVHRLLPAPGFRGAAVVEGPVRALRLHRWDGPAAG
jgi:4'-phosphopantetheinyl transferase